MTPREITANCRDNCPNHYNCVFYLTESLKEMEDCYDDNELVEGDYFDDNAPNGQD